ncbi:D-xylose 1-dehydrogenase Gfo6 [Halosimplex salinum]|uniref:D-xylose 1-dehydrogenase Gfo6 n=1 Tax=Halosimplex salinum TaxID=1710538 RepID=UPI000F4679B0|nr:D-xylose 1-dehydrogenase Gfo6 [Halosimplex salinum]
MDLHEYFDEFTTRDWPQADEGTVRFAMVGLGWWTLDHAIPATNDLEHLETTVVVSSSTEKAEGVAEDHETIEHGLTYDEFQDGVATDAYDAVYIATPNALHLPYVEAAAEFGKDILCEKPLEANTERAEKVVAAASDVTLGVEYRMHVQPAVRMMRELIDSGFIGDPTLVHGNMSQLLLEINDNEDQWRLNPSLAGAGASVTDLGVYSINTSRFVLDRDPVAVSGATWSEHDAFDEVPDERAAFTVEFEDGVLASCTASQNAQYASSLRVVGTKGELLLEDAFLGDERVLTVTRGDTTITTEFDQIQETKRSLEYFADHVLTDTPILGDGEHGLVDQQAIDAVYEAADEGERVEL